MAKLVAAFFLALIAISILQTMVGTVSFFSFHSYIKIKFQKFKVFIHRSWHHMDMEVIIMIKNIMALEASRVTNVHQSAREDAVKPNTISRACSSVKNVAANAFACPPVIMATKLFALATTIGRPKKEDPSALIS
ncbi:hypothetical protein V6N12_044977 [Hibiscus sabdariffa]|uniref:Uncharacterized protein n=1 Tax=Hibiscus sabdariffa TaxID=183260 RepID=A0ABR2G2A1_9ROSI